MPESPSITEKFLNDVVSARKELAPTAQFAGLTLDQFESKVKPTDTRTEISAFETQLKAARQSRVNADVVSNETALNVVNAVRGAPGFGENSALYKAMGYVPKNERKSGLVRPSTNPATTTVPTLKAA